MTTENKHNPPEQPRSLQNHGRIKLVLLPSGWQKENSRKPFKDMEPTTGFRPAGGQYARLVFFDNRRPLSLLTSKLFRKILCDGINLRPVDSFADKCTLESLKVQGMRELLGNMALPDVFRIDTIVTTKIHYQNGLLIVGQYLNGGIRSHFLMLPGNDEHTSVQEAFYSAQEEIYETYAVGALAALHSMELTTMA